MNPDTPPAAPSSRRFPVRPVATLALAAGLLAGPTPFCSGYGCRCTGI
ncbi:hypothetical protein ACVW0Q_002446 [Thermostichus sp. MS-CIW-21]